MKMRKQLTINDIEIKKLLDNDNFRNNQSYIFSNNHLIKNYMVIKQIKSNIKKELFFIFIILFIWGLILLIKILKGFYIFHLLFYSFSFIIFYFFILLLGSFIEKRKQSMNYYKDKNDYIYFRYKPNGLILFYKKNNEKK